MYKQSTCLTLIALLALSSSSSSASRQPRSLWPWSSIRPTEEPLIPEKHAEILRQSGYGEYLDLSKHPIWKIHKYEGIDLKPVEVETEIIKSAGQPPEVAAARNPVSSVAPLTESDVTEQPPDLSFLDNLGGLAYFLPDADDDDEEETQKANILAGAIANEEQSHPGFFGKLWSKLWGSDESKNEASVESVEDDSALLQIALPATKENYAEIRLVQPSAQLAGVQSTVNQGNQYAFAAGASQAAKPVDKWYKPADHVSRSQAWVQSWNPSAAYNVHVEGPSEYPAEHVATVQAYTADPGNHFQRKVSKDEEVASMANEEERVVEVQNLPQMSVSEDEEKPEVADVNKDSQIAVADSEKKDNANVNIDSETNVSEDDKTSANVDNESPRTVSEDEKKKEPVVVVAEGQGQEVAGELESSTVVTTTRASILRQKAVNALKMNIVPKRFFKQLNISEQEIDDFVNNRESSNRTWEKIQIHLHQLGPRFPAVRRIFFV